MLYNADKSYRYISHFSVYEVKYSYYGTELLEIKGELYNLALL